MAQVSSTFRNTVADLIIDGSKYLCRIWIGAHSTAPDDFRAIGKMVREGRIHIAIGSEGQYGGRSNTLTVPYMEGQNAQEYQGMLMHEDSRDISDWVGRRINSIHEEALAHVAEIMFLDRVGAPWDKENTLYAAAHAVAAALLAGHSATSQDQDRLFGELRRLRYISREMHGSGIPGA